MTVPSREGIKGDGVGSAKALVSGPETVGNTHTLLGGVSHLMVVRSSPPGIEPVGPALGTQSLNHWTTREVLHSHFKTCGPVSRRQVHGSLRWHF